MRWREGREKWNLQSRKLKRQVVLLMYRWRYEGSSRDEVLMLDSEKMPEEWRKSGPVQMFKNKADVQNWSSDRERKLMRLPT